MLAGCMHKRQLLGRVLRLHAQALIPALNLTSGSGRAHDDRLHTQASIGGQHACMTYVMRGRVAGLRACTVLPPVGVRIITSDLC